MSAGLEGDWQLVRTGGMLPPLVGVPRRIEGDHGWTSLGPLPGTRFDVVGSEGFAAVRSCSAASSARSVSNAVASCPAYIHRRVDAGEHVSGQFLKDYRPADW